LYYHDIQRAITSSIDLKKKLLSNDELLRVIGEISTEIVTCFKNDKKVLFCGNGGSAADAQHLAAELSGRLYFNRDPLFSEALHLNPSYITAVANDYSFDEVYSRLVKAKGRRGDVLVGISTSGNSKNVVKSLQLANSLGMVTVGLTGEDGGDM